MKYDVEYQKDLMERNKEPKDLMMKYASKARDVKVGLYLRDSSGKGEGTKKLKLDFKGHGENE